MLPSFGNMYGTTNPWMIKRSPKLHSFTLDDNISSIAEAKKWRTTMIYSSCLSTLLHTISFNNWQLLWKTSKTTTQMTFGNSCGETANTKKIYNTLLGNNTCPAPPRWIWKSCCMSKYKFFSWLMLNDRINTCDLQMIVYFLVMLHYQKIQFVNKPYVFFLFSRIF